MKLKRVSFLCACTLLFSLFQPARAAPAYPELVVDDIRHVLTAPSRWESQEWQNFGWATLAVVGTAAIVDRPLRDEMRRQSGTSGFMRNVERFGVEYSLGVLGAFYLAGAVGNNDKAMRVAQDGVAASLIASGMITPALKYATGRSRPRDNAGIYDFKPLRDSNASFPPGIRPKLLPSLRSSRHITMIDGCSVPHTPLPDWSAWRAATTMPISPRIYWQAP